MGMRRKSRELAVQALYALSFAETSPELGPLQWLSEFREELENLAEEAGVVTAGRIFAFAVELLDSTLRHVDTIDAQISSHATNWSFERISPLDKSILRVGVNELLYTDTAPAIVINEAIEVSKKYSSENAGKFVNGILNAISKEKDA